MKLSGRWLALLVGLYVAVPGCFGAARADDYDRILAAKRITIAIDLGAAPFGFYDNSMNPAGLDVETAQVLAKQLHVELQIVPVNSSNRIPFLLSGKVDAVIASFGITDERKKVIAFSIPYSSVPSIVAGPPDVEVSGWASLAGKSIVVTRGTSNDLDVTTHAPKGTDIVRYDDDATSMTAIISGQHDLFATAPSLIETINARNPRLKLERKFTVRDLLFGVGLRHEDVALKAHIDAAIVAGLKDHELEAIHEKWLHEKLPQSVLAGAS
jgi:polar amino acid transport system substrate-binding protein